MAKGQYLYARKLPILLAIRYLARRFKILIVTKIALKGDGTDLAKSLNQRGSLPWSGQGMHQNKKVFAFDEKKLDT